MDRNLPDAIRAIERSLEGTPDYALTKYGQARLLPFAGRLDAALPQLDAVLAVLALNRLYHRVLSFKSVCQFARDDMSGALETAQKSRDRAPHDPLSLAGAAAAAGALS